ncbi:MAG: hypothetical protein ABEH43_00560 [Flavobacteriales bacterium]
MQQSHIQIRYYIRKLKLKMDHSYKMSSIAIMFVVVMLLCFSLRANSQQMQRYGIKASFKYLSSKKEIPSQDNSLSIFKSKKELVDRLRIILRKQINATYTKPGLIKMMRKYYVISDNKTGTGRVHLFSSRDNKTISLVKKRD